MRALIAAKSAARRRPTYIAGLRQYLEAFARGRETTPLDRIKLAELESWFASRNESASGRASNVGRLSALFSYAIRRGWIRDNPCHRLERIRIDHAPPKILTVEQCRRLLTYCNPTLRPWVSACLFAGLRPSEAERIDWSSIRLTGPEPCIVVDASASKVRRRRIVPLLLAAVAWLSPDARPAGRLVSSHSTLRRARREVVESSGVPWSPDVLRHTYGSMRIAAGDSPERVAADMGNSPRILLTHYRELVTREEAEKFWKLFPPAT